MEKGQLKVYKSSAGSGKTYTLVKEFVGILISSDSSSSYRNVLAITFTNKAANEMKQRVLQSLETIGAGTSDRLIKDYSITYGISEKKLISKCRELHQRILHDYGDFGILTIDKFIHRVIRSFSRELGLNINFEIETNSGEFISRSVDSLLNEVGEDPLLTKYLVEFVQQGVIDSGKQNIESDLTHMSSIFYDESNSEKLEALRSFDLEFYEGLKNKVGKDLQGVLEDRNELIKAALRSFDSYQFDISGLNGGVRQSWGKYLSELREDFNSHLEDISGIDKLEKRIDDSKLFKKGDVESTAGLLLEVEPVLRAILDKERGLLRIKEFQRRFVGFSLLNELWNVIQGLKDQHNLMFISDFNQVVSNIVKNEPTPFIYERIGAKYDHFLIDEFQDTSDLQWTNLVPLVHDSLAQGGTNLLVGDAKQAIYRWRGGNVHQFINLPRVFSNVFDGYSVNELFVDSYQEHFLEANYRSRREIVEFNNWVFKGIIESDDSVLGKVYENAAQRPMKEGSGRVFFRQVDPLNDDEALDFITEEIALATDKGYEGADVAVLVRTKKEGRVVSEFLRTKGYFVESVDSVVLSGSLDVRKLQCLLHILRDDDPTSFCVKYLELEEGNNFQSKLEDLRSVEDGYGFKIKRSQFIERVLPEFDLIFFYSLYLLDRLYYLIQHLGLNRSDPYVDGVVNLATSFVKKYAANTESFVDYFDDHLDKVAIKSGGSLGIQVVTIHKSKGLEFPVVIIPFLDWEDSTRGIQTDTLISSEFTESYGLPAFVCGLSEKKLSLYGLQEVSDRETIDRQLDNLNLIYVAFTRATSMLSICSRLTSFKNHMSHKVAELIQSRQDFTDGTLEIGELEKVLIKETGNDQQMDVSYKGVEERDKLSVQLDAYMHPGNISEASFGALIHEFVQLELECDQTGIKLLRNDARYSDEVVRKAIECAGRVVLKLEELNWLKVGSSDYSCEQEIIDDNGRVFRPDLTIRDTSGVKIIDFKTGKQEQKHIKQMLGYGELYRAMGCKNVRLYLYYIVDNVIVEVDV